jgi:hypothetical protein
MVVLGIGREVRKSFFSWRESNPTPNVIFEVTSPGKIDIDLQGKRELYERLGVAEYFLFDPRNETINPRLQGLKLREGRYVPIESDSTSLMYSEQLQVGLMGDGMTLRLFDPGNGETIRTQVEEAEEQKRQTRKERRGRKAAERAFTIQKQRAEQAQAETESERQRADVERKSAEQAIAKQAELLAELERLRSKQNEQ